MAKQCTLILALVLLVSISDASPGKRPTWLGDYCTKNSDCNPGECCIYRPDRYSIPECRRFEEEGDQCIPHAPTLNTTLYYPDGTHLQLSNVHRILCPCMQNLKCDKDGICRSNVIE